MSGGKTMEGSDTETTSPTRWTRIRRRGGASSNGHASRTRRWPPTSDQLARIRRLRPPSRTQLTRIVRGRRSDDDKPSVGHVDRRRLLAVIAAVAVGSAVVGWVAGQRIKSPAEIASETDAPPPSLITVPVEELVLSQNVVVRGTVRSSDATELAAPAIEGSTVITRLPMDVGDLVSEGDVLIEVAGRPIIALEGELPMFRNLIPTLEGPDVEQLEEALARMGYEPGDIDGVYSTETSAAVTELYLDAGYSTAALEGGEEEAVEAAEAAVRAQEQIVADAELALAEARAAVPPSQKLALDQAVTSAENQLDLARTGATEAKAQAAAAVSEAAAARAAAADAASSTAERLQQAQNGTHPDTGQPPTSQQLAALQSEADTAQAALTAANDAHTAAEAARTRVDTEQGNLVSEAQSNLALQKALRDEGLRATGTAAFQARLDDAEDALDDAEDALDEARAKVGAPVPASELVFLPSLPREVQALNVGVGDLPSGPVMTVSGSETVIESGLSAADRQLVEVGTEALLEDDGLGLSIPALVTFVAESPGGPDLSADRYAMQLEPLEDLPDEAMNLNMRVSIPISTTGGEVLAVPFAALSAGPDGSARVEVERSTGETELVEVSTGLRADGMVEIEPLEGDLVPGDRVVVGRDLVLPGSEPDDSDSSDSSDSSGSSDSEESEEEGSA